VCGHPGIGVGRNVPAIYVSMGRVRKWHIGTKKGKGRNKGESRGLLKGDYAFDLNFFISGPFSHK